MDQTQLGHRLRVTMTAVDLKQRADRLVDLTTRMQDATKKNADQFEPGQTMETVLARLSLEVADAQYQVGLLNASLQYILGGELLDEVSAAECERLSCVHDRRS